MNLKKILACCTITLGLLVSSAYSAKVKDLIKLSDKAIESDKVKHDASNGHYYLEYHSKKGGIENNLFMDYTLNNYTFFYEKIIIQDGKKHIAHLFLEDGGRDGWPNGEVDYVWATYRIFNKNKECIFDKNKLIDLKNPETKEAMQKKFDAAVETLLKK